MPEATKFRCPNCQAEYKVVRIEAPLAHDYDRNCLGVFPVQRLNAWAKELTSQYPNKQFRGLAMSQMVYCCCAATENVGMFAPFSYSFQKLTGCNESSRNRCPDHDQ